MVFDTKQLVVLAIRSVCDNEPVLIWPALVALRYQRLLNLQFHPERCDTTAVSSFFRHFDSVEVSVKVPIWLTLMD